VRWLTGVHPAEGREYLVRERYEELLWWLQLPLLLRVAGETAPSLAAAHRAVVRTISKTIEEAIAAAEAVGYRVDLLQAQATTPAAVEEQASNADSVAETAGASEDAVAFPSLKAQPKPEDPPIEPAG
jgi:hypothetical protein